MYHLITTALYNLSSKLNITKLNRDDGQFRREYEMKYIMRCTFIPTCSDSYTIYLVFGFIAMTKSRDWTLVTFGFNSEPTEKLGIGVSQWVGDQTLITVCGIIMFEKRTLEIYLNVLGEREIEIETYSKNITVTFLINLPSLKTKVKNCAFISPHWAHQKKLQCCFVVLKIEINTIFTMYFGCF